MARLILLVALAAPAAAQDTTPLRVGEAAPFDGRLYSTMYDEKTRRLLRESVVEIKSLRELKKLGEEARDTLDRCLEQRTGDQREMAKLAERLRLAQEAKKLETPQADLLRHLLYGGAVVATTAGGALACDIGAEAGGMDTGDRRKLCPLGGALAGLILTMGLAW